MIYLRCCVAALAVMFSHSKQKTSPVKETLTRRDLTSHDIIYMKFWAYAVLKLCSEGESVNRRIHRRPCAQCRRAPGCVAGRGPGPPKSPSPESPSQSEMRKSLKYDGMNLVGYRLREMIGVCHAILRLLNNGCWRSLNIPGIF